MRILVLGGSGGTGHQIVSQALAAGHDVTVLARNPSTIATQHQRLRIVEGRADGGSALSEAMQQQDAVISAIGRGKSFKPEQLMEQCVTAILRTMTKRRVRRLMLISALGVGESFNDSPMLAKIFFRTLLRGIYADKLIGDQLIRASAVDWTIVQPCVLTNGPRNARYRAGERLALMGMPTISRADTAHYILDRLNDTSTYRKTIILAN